MSRWVLGASLLALLFAIAPGCEAPPSDPDSLETGGDGKGDSSAVATVLDFEFDGELVHAGYSTPNARIIREQLFYTIGHLNGNRAVGRLDKVTLSNIKATRLADGRVHLRYHAILPVAWSHKTLFPKSYAFSLPRDVTRAGLLDFTTKYKRYCADLSPHPIDAGSMWYYYRPTYRNCKLAAEDIVKTTATVRVGANNTTGKYPEYDKIWEDGALRVVAIFGKNMDGSASNYDAGVSAFNNFTVSMKKTLALFSLKTEPSQVPALPGVAMPDVTFRGTLADGRTVEVVALLVDNIRDTTAEFDARYEELSQRADLIAYNGHAGLGQNVEALAKKGTWVAGQYLVLFMNGCDTFAYVDGSLAQARARVNPDDPTGTRYMDIVTNAMPSFFHSNADSSTALVRNFLHDETPKTYEQIFREIDPLQVVLVTGEEDNEFTP